MLLVVPFFSFPFVCRGVYLPVVASLKAKCTMQTNKKLYKYSYIKEKRFPYNSDG